MTQHRAAEACLARATRHSRTCPGLTRSTGGVGHADPLIATGAWTATGAEPRTRLSRTRPGRTTCSRWPGRIRSTGGCGLPRSTRCSPLAGNTRSTR